MTTAETRRPRSSTEDTAKTAKGRGVIVAWRSVAFRFALLFSVSSVLSVVSVSPLYSAAPPAPAAQSVAEAEAKTKGCMSCHTATDRHTMHQNPGVVLGCTDCHGG